MLLVTTEREPPPSLLEIIHFTPSRCQRKKPTKAQTVPEFDSREENDEDDYNNQRDHSSHDPFLEDDHEDGSEFEFSRGQIQQVFSPRSPFQFAWIS